MEIILKEDVRHLGHKNDVVTVKDGYANNFLFPQGLAILATPSAKKQLAETMKQRAHKEEKLISDAKAIAEKLSGVSVTIPTKVSQSGKIYGSVNNIQVAEALAAQGFEIEGVQLWDVRIVQGDKKNPVGTVVHNVPETMISPAPAPR